MVKARDGEEVFGVSTGLGRGGEEVRRKEPNWRGRANDRRRGGEQYSGENFGIEGNYQLSSAAKLLRDGTASPAEDLSPCRRRRRA